MPHQAALRSDIPDSAFDLAGKLAAVDVQISAHDAARMDEVVAAVHDAVLLPAYRDAALAGASAIARCAPQRVESLFSGFDFHLSPTGPKLIEINTNAGGAFYGALIDEKRRARGDVQAKKLSEWSALFVGHFRSEWLAAGRSGELRTVAIVDDTPDEQFLRLEFQVAAQMLREAGIATVIADPRTLGYRDGRLRHGANAIDFVYNRLTSFNLEREVDRALRDALLDGAVVVSPDPRAHALLACKTNLIRLSDDAFLRAAGADARTREILAQAVPRTLAVTAENERELWAARARHYFKPASGFGSRAVYDGAKLTAKTWQVVVGEGGSIAQEKVEAPRVNVGGVAMRFDVRNFAFGRAPFMRLARVYRGQTTNFRTPGGGFAPVRVKSDA
ncbi:MAG: hypothetical protein K8S25_14810 [Alphaproteobacteria bacterium]|nr:hypothetical protein [Alphaproteobacteria bacterium]